MNTQREASGKLPFNLDQELSAIAVEFEREKIDYALCGGLAVALYGYPRATQDIDILIRSEDLDRVLAALENLGFNLPAGIIPFDVGKVNERRIFRVSKISAGELLTIDLLLVSPALKEIWSGREKYTIEEVPVFVVSLEGLIKMKRLAGRSQDIADLERLEEN